VNVIVNGAPRELPLDATVADVLADLHRDPKGRGVAVAMNGEVLPRSLWATTSLTDRDRLEILDAVQGG
jgi:sulfur carrier protein